MAFDSTFGVIVLSWEVMGQVISISFHIVIAV